MDMEVFLSMTDTSVKSQNDKNLRVMIVDNHEIFRHGLRNLLNGIDGFSVVVEVACARDAIAQVEVIHIDLIFMNLSLPDAEGIETIQLLRKGNPSLQIIILASVLDDDGLLDSMLAGASGFLTTDMPAIDLISTLQGFQQGMLALAPAAVTKLVRLLVQKCNDLTWHNEGLEAELTRYLQNGEKVPGLSASGLPYDALPSTNTHLHILTPQEEKVFRLMRQGQSNKQIAAHLSISHYTVGKHVQSILRKFGVMNRTQAVSYASFEGGISPCR